MEPKQIKKINALDLKLGMKFTAPVFFDDGIHMFLAENYAVRKRHIAAIQYWEIKHLLTYGSVIEDAEHLSKQPPIIGNEAEKEKAS